MSLEHTPRPLWLTFDCYGTLIQWDEGLLAYVQVLLERKGVGDLDPGRFIAVYDGHEHRLEQAPPYRSFREICELSLRLTLQELGLDYSEGDADALAASISRMPPFPEVVETLGWLKAQGFKLCILSNTDDSIIAGNVQQMGGHIDRVITAQQGRAYKPSAVLFTHAHQQLGVQHEQFVHICASPHLDLTAARDMGFRCVWVDRGTGRKLLPDYQPDAVVANLAQVRDVFARAGWVRN